MFDKRLTKLCPESKKYIAGNIVLQWVELCMNAVMIFIVARTVDRLYHGLWGIEDMLLPVVVMLCTVAVRFFTARYAVRMSFLASRSVKKTMRDAIYTKLLRLGTSYREHSSGAELVQESVEGVEQLESYFGLYVPQFFYAFLAPVSLFFLFGFAGSWTVAAILLICVPLIPGAIMMVQKIAKKLLAKYWGQYTQLGSTFLENLQGMTTLKTYQADGFKNEQMNAESEHFRQITMKVLTMQLNSIIIMDLVAYGGAALGIVFAARAFLNGTLGLESCIFMILLSADFFLPMRRLGSYFHIAMNGMAASDKIFSFLGEEEASDRNETACAGDIVLRDICFSYDAEREILKGINMLIPCKSFTAIVGESGSGKSTIASLIMRRNTPSSGELLIGGVPVARISEHCLMGMMSYVGSGAVFFKGTVRENLLYADPEASDEALWRMLDEGVLSEFLREQQGLDTVLLENAANLSGGQRQRLALARAMLHDSDIYIFDEASSNIDMESEDILLRKMHEMTKTKTVIIISHRLSSVADADNIYCLKKGELAESGTHTELLEKNGVYARLWHTQQELENYGKDVA